MILKGKNDDVKELYVIIKIPKKDEVEVTAAEVSLPEGEERSVGHEARKER